MTAALLALALCAGDPYESSREDGVIRGIVVNASQGDRPAGQVTVMLPSCGKGCCRLAVVNCRRLFPSC